MNRLFLSTSLLSMSLGLMLFASPVLAGNALPAEVAQSLSSAYTTNDRFVINATKEKLIGIFPDLRSQISAFNGQNLAATTVTPSTTAPSASAPTLTLTPAVATGDEMALSPEQLNDIETTAGVEEETSSWGGSVEGGLSVATGNTEEESLNVKGTLDYEVEHWKNALEASARNKKESDTRTAEEYRVNDQLNYKLNERHYIYGEAGYVDDRFSGYDYRINEGIGYGYYFIKEDSMSLLGEIGPGGRHSKLTSGEKENELIGKIGEKFEWDINDRLSFEQDASVEYGQELTIINAGMGLKADIHKSLYLKLGFEVENLSEVPAGTDKTDTLTTVNLGYDF